ncbi:MAG: hypothetical protein ABW095_18555 [Candidatus Thiodiazotropha sp.]
MMTQMRNYVRYGVLGVLLSSCTLPVDIRNSGYFEERDLTDFADTWLRVSSYQYSPGHTNILSRGVVHMTGRYRFEGDSRTGGSVEFGQIDLEINFADKDVASDGSFVIPIVSGTLSKVTGLLPGVPDFGVGWSGELPITGSVTVEEAVGAAGDPPLIGFEVSGSLSSIPAEDGGATSQRNLRRVFSGTFLQEFELGVHPLSVAGTVQLDASSTVNPNNQFYLEQVR